MRNTTQKVGTLLWILLFLAVLVWQAAEQGYFVMEPVVTEDTSIRERLDVEQGIPDDRVVVSETEELAPEPKTKPTPETEALPEVVEPKVPSEQDDIQEVSTHIVDSTVARDSAVLSESGIIILTNKERERNGVAPLVENTALNEAAQQKVLDMFIYQYFEHDSPTGVGVEDWANAVDYEYIVVGENLALGGFDHDAAVLEGWMNSPGHRENILNGSYTEIGVAALDGHLDGDFVTLAVQVFGRPLSLCEKPDTALKEQLLVTDTVLRGTLAAIESMEDMLKSYNPLNPVTIAEYNDLVGEYNELVDKYNVLLGEYRSVADVYNAQVIAFNACIEID